MRIGLVCPYDLDAPGGVQRVVLDLADHLRSGGDDVVVLGPGSGHSHAYLSIGRAVVVRGNRSAVPVTFDPRALGRIRRLLEDVEVVHVHEPFIPLGGWGGIWAGRPTVATFHADPAQWTRRTYRLAARLGRRWLAGATVTAVSPVAAAALPPAWHPVEIIPNAIDTGAFGADGERSAQVAFLGRDDPRKGLDTLLAAWPQVRRLHPEAKLVVLGTDRQAPVEGVEYRGRVSEQEKRRCLAASAVFVAPNLGGESFGIIIAEAMAAGCAVVASDLAAFRPVVDGAGRLVPVGDPAALGSEIGSLLSDPGAARDLGQAARRSARRFDWSVVGASYRRVYESAVAGVGSTMRPHKE